ncbi:MAG: BON domain-containing protein [Acidobacteria bacterium]|nr:BON domain-containing protein [Acidobacteriota bacterium]MBV9484342.1 BON domain-containing protein [Acidobacteriota bacterium]
MRHTLGASVIAFALCLSSFLFAQAGQSGAVAANTTSTAQSRPLSENALQRITQEVRHQLVMLPFYSVFDDLAYQVSPDGTVTLIGQVRDPTLKPDAERAVKKIEGVERVVNNIEVLPTSPNDDRIRRAVYRAIYGNDSLAPYSLRAVPPIHIIVKNGNVTLTGVVARQMDKQIAEMQAKSVPGVFSVQDNLQVENTKG